MFTDRSGLSLLPTCKDWRAVSASLEPHGLRTVEGNLGDFLKENQEAIPEGGLAGPRQRETADVCRGREAGGGEESGSVGWFSNKHLAFFYL